MPAGVSWSNYLKFASASLFSMFVGSQTVHQFYHPMRDFDKFLEEYRELREKEIIAKVEQELQDQALIEQHKVKELEKQGKKDAK